MDRPNQGKHIIFLHHRKEKKTSSDVVQFINKQPARPASRLSHLALFLGF
jgi:hypothetical protein